MHTKSYRVQKLSAYFTAPTAQVPITSFQALEVCDGSPHPLRDRFGNHTTCDFVQLQEMPLLATGTIDRKQLAGVLQSSANYIAPRTEIEEQLISIWQQVLNVPQVGIHDNFFELGGTSLLAVRLFSNIEQTFGKKLPLASLFPSGTVEALAKTIYREEELALANQVLEEDLSEDKSETLWSCLVEIQPNGSQPPLFCIHPLGGEILCYRPLAMCLGLDQPVYGLQPLGLDGKHPPLNCVEDMAVLYIKAMQTIQPRGPYYIAGYSFGGIVAYEIAQQLHSQGDKVAILAMLDTNRPGSDKRLPFVLRVVEHVNNFVQEGPGYLQRKLVGWSEWGAYNIREKYKQLLENSEVLPEGDNHLDILGANDQALSQYTFQPYPGRMILLRTDDKTRTEAVGDIYDPLFGWGELVAGGIDVYHIPGSHLSVLDEPEVQVLAEKLKLCLEEAYAMNLTKSK